MRLRAVAVVTHTAARSVLAAPGGIAVSVGFYVAVVSVVAALWRAATGANGGAIAGYSAAALTWYIATSEAATVSLNTRMIEETGETIATGAVAAELLRPASVLGVRVASELGGALPRLAALVASGTLLCWLVVGPPPRLAGAVLAVPALVLAIACNLAAQHAFASASFWVRESRSSWFLYQKLVFVVGGMLLPLEVLPDGMQAAARVLPFMAMAYAPARLASGHVEPHLLVVQAVWLGVVLAVASWLFAAGERRLQVVGG